MRDSFTRLFDLNVNKNTFHGISVTSEPKVLLYETKHGECHAVKLGTHLKIADGVLDYVQSTMALECPSRRLSAKVRPAMLLPSDISCTDV